MTKQNPLQQSFRSGSSPSLAKFLLSSLSAFVLFGSQPAFSQNEIVIENALPGNPPAEWEISAENTSIQGFPADFSVNKGDTVRFKINVPDTDDFSMKIYRVGYYQGNGARLQADLGTFTGTAQPAHLYDPNLGLADCGNWSESVLWPIPATAVSGIYFAKVVRASDGGANHILFIVRDDTGNAPVLYKTSDSTWQAYNTYGGHSLYCGATPGRPQAVKVSYQRPLLTRFTFCVGGPNEYFRNAEYPLIRWMERNGYHVSYTSQRHMSRNLAPITPAMHKILISCGHDEYWSAGCRDAFEAARANGVHLCFMSGNEVYWKTRWEDDFDTLVCYKEGTLGDAPYVSGGDSDPTQIWTGLWRDGAGYDATDGGNNENSLTGQMSWTQLESSITVPDTFKDLRFWKNTAVASLGPGGSVALSPRTLGREWDPYQPQFAATDPPNKIRLSETFFNGNTHHLTLYRHSSGALVFGAGTEQWSWGLMESMTGGGSVEDLNIQQATVNLFAYMDVPANQGDLQAGLIAEPGATADDPPVTTITAPGHGETLSASTVVINGTASVAADGVLMSVEVSVDGGATWNAVTGTNPWFYEWNPSGPGIYNIQSRALDDLGNMDSPGAVGSANNITVTIGAASSTDPPSPDPAVFATAPAADGQGTISMTSIIGSYSTGPVEYFFDETSGNPGGSDSGWQTSPSYSDTGLTGDTQYTYTVTMRDGLGNTGTASSAESATTLPPDTFPPTPNPASFAAFPAALSDTAISMTATTGSDPAGPVAYYFAETSGNPGGSDSGWQTSRAYTDTGLNATTEYTYTVIMRDAESPTPNVGTASSGASATTLAPGAPPTPVQYWRLDDGSGTTAVNQIGGGNTGSLSGPPAWITSGLPPSLPSSAALDFASGDHLDGGNLNLTSNGGGGQASVSMWLRPETLTGDVRLIGQLSGASSQNGVVGVGQSAGVGGLWVWDGAGFGHLTNPGTLITGSWQHLALVWDTGQVTAYLDGVAQLTATANFDFGAGNGNFGVAAKFLGIHGDGFDGQIDDVAIYGAALDQTQVWNLANPSATDTTPPVIATLDPVDDATGVATPSNLAVTFDENVAFGTGDITLRTSGGGLVEAFDVTSSPNLSLSGATVTINPTSNLIGGASYYVEIDSTAIDDLAGNSFAGISGGTTWDFMTSVNLLTAFTGGDAPEGLDLSGNITYAFNLGGPALTVQGVTFAAASRTAPPTGLTTAGSNQFDYSTVNAGGANGANYGATADDNALELMMNTVWYDPNWTFDLAVTPGTQYQLQLILQEAWFTYQGTTSRNFDVSVETASPSTLTLAIDDLALSTATDGAAAAQPGSDQGLVYTYTFTALDSSFRVALDDSPAGSDPNAILNAVVLKSLTADTTPPNIAILNPTDDATGVSSSSDLVVTFDESVAFGTGDITLRTSGGGLVEAFDVTSSPNLSLSGTTVTINPGSDLADSTGYYVQIDPSAIDDTSGNSFAGITDTTTWSFTTGSTPTIVLFDDFSTDPDLATEWTEYGYFPPESTTPTWNSGDGDLDLSKPTGSNGFGLYRTGALRSPTDPVTLTVKELNRTSGGWGFLGLMISAIEQPSYVVSTDDSYTFALASTGGTNVRYEVRRTYQDGTSNFLLKVGTSFDLATNGPTTLAIVRNGDHYEFLADSVLFYTTAVPAAGDTYDTAAKDSLVYFQIVQNGDGAMTSTVDDFGVASGGGNDFSDWIALYPGVGGQTGFTDDPDGDGLRNGIEAFLGTNPSVSSSSWWSQMSVSGAVMSFEHPETASPLDDVTGFYEWSLDLENWNASGDTVSGTTVTIVATPNTPVVGTTTVDATSTGTIPTELFLRVGATQ